MLHYSRKQSRRKITKSKGNRINTHKNNPKNKSNIKLRKRLNKGLVHILGGAIILGILFWAGSAIYKLIQNSGIPNEATFSSCSNYFLQIKASPAYGVIIYTDGDDLEKIVLTAPDNALGIRNITIPSDSWMVVYFSPNFTFTQVSGFLRLSTLETDNPSYCYILEQLSLSSGVPIEYAIVKDKKGKLYSTISTSEANAMLASINENSTYSFDKKLLPTYVLGDGTEVPVVTYAAFLEQFPDFFKIQEVAQEQAFVEVYNVTAISGYASIVSKRWEMLGIDISRVGNANHEKLEGIDAVIYIRNPDQYVRTLGMIKGTFSGDSIKIIEGRPASVVTTGDIVVFLLNR